MKWKKKGSLTVEASFIISMSLIIVGLMLSLCFFIYQRCWYTQAACESVLTGSALGIWKGESIVEQTEGKWKSRKEEFFLKPENLTANCSGNKDRVLLEISGKTAVWGRAALEFSNSVSQKGIRPVRYIWKVQALMGGGG